MKKLMTMDFTGEGVTITDEKTGQHLLTITNEEAEKRMPVAGLSMYENEDIFTYANHLLGNQFQGYHVE